MANSFDTEREPLEIETVAQLANNIVWRLPGCADEAVRRALQSAFADFCRGSCALTAKRCVEVGEGERICELCVTPSHSDRYVDCVKGVTHNGRPLVQGRDYFIFDTNVRLRHAYNNGVFEITTVEMPMDGSESAPSWFLKRYGSAIESGALARLMSMTGKAWSDPTQAKIEATTFNDHMTHAKLAYYTGGTLSNGAASVTLNASEGDFGGLI